MRRIAFGILILMVLVLILSCGDDDKGTNGTSDDTIAPSAISDLSVTAPSCGIVELTWTATGDDGFTGIATSYDARYFRAAITDANFDQATQLPGEPVPSEAGETETFTASGFEAGKEYHFAVKAIDEASNASDLSNVALKAASALPDRGILLIDRTHYSQHALGSIWGGCGTCCDYGVDLRTERYQPYFRNLFQQAGNPIDSLYWVEIGHPIDDVPLSLELLNHYELVILMTETFYVTYESIEVWLDRLTEYMDGGGKVLVIGRDIFWIVFDGPPALIYIAPGDIRYDYFGMSGVFCPNWLQSWLEYKVNCTADHANEEFIGAGTLVEGLPDLNASFEHLEEYFGGWGSRGCDGEPYNHDRWCRWQNIEFTPYPYRGVPEVNYFITNGIAEPLYTAVSIDAGEGLIHGEVCGLRCQTDCFKSAVFGFPLYSIEEDDAVALLQGMIEWFDIE